KLYEDIYDFPIGFSDHSAGFLGAAIAVSYNACIIEKHFTLDKNLDGPDHGISADYDELKSLVENCMLAFEMKGEKEKIVHENELGGRFFGRRSLYKQNGQAIALRPAKHLREEGVLDSWQIELGGQGLPSTNEWEVIKLKS
ncbi:MAG: N-acetylneuraminate synthase family protein, partial [Leptospiraceae bacterium]|nr:N-acetylneuraminate synthase family protein [Leptospiraceae bacterium]